MRHTVATFAVLFLFGLAANAQAEPRLSLSSTKVKPGDPVLVTVTGVDEAPRGQAGKRALQFFAVRGGWQAVFAVPLEEPPGSIAVDVGPLRDTVVVAAHQFPLEENLEVPAAYASPGPVERARIDDDNQAIVRALANEVRPLFDGAFRVPAGRVTSRFGALRTFVGDDHQSRHLGVDLDLRRGTPVRSMQRGKVALVHEGYLTGGTVVVVHGAGLGAAYFHLGEISVREGDDVDAGQLLGKVGATGRTTGPHLHVAVWASGGFVDPLVFRKLKIKKPLPPPASAGL